MRESGATNETTGHERADELELRLLRRATEPIGIIDVKHAERLGTRIAPWILERLGLLADWKARYALDLGGASQEQRFSGLSFVEPFSVSPEYGPISSPAVHTP